MLKDMLLIFFFFEGTAIVLTIPELALLAVFTRHTISQGSIYTFEIMGLVVSSLTLLLLPVLCVCRFSALAAGERDDSHDQRVNVSMGF